MCSRKKDYSVISNCLLANFARRTSPLRRLSPFRRLHNETLVRQESLPAQHSALGYVVEEQHASVLRRSLIVRLWKPVVEDIYQLKTVFSVVDTNSTEKSIAQAHEELLPALLAEVVEKRN